MRVRQQKIILWVTVMLPIVVSLHTGIFFIKPAMANSHAVNFREFFRLDQQPEKKNHGGDLLGSDQKNEGDDLLAEPAKKRDDGDLLSGPEEKKDKDLLLGTGRDLKKTSDDKIAEEASAAHEKLFVESRFPSATTCGTCHPKHYREWSVSQHAYAQLSPVYLSIQNFLNLTTSGSMGDFCFRCHSQVGAILNESPAMSNLKRHPTSREGITCIVCHRVNMPYNKVSGRIGLVEGDILQPVYGPTGNKELKRVLKNSDKYRVVTEAGKAGRKIHTNVKKFAPLSTPAFCGTCHDVTLFNGFRLEEAFSEYRMSPAAARGVTRRRN